MEEHVSINRKQKEWLYSYTNHMLKISVNHHPSIDCPKVTIGKSVDSIIHNIKIKKNDVGNTILYFETNQKYVTIYDTQSSYIAVSSDDVDNFSMHLPSYIITLELLDVSMSEHIHNCVVTPLKHQYHCAFIPSKNCTFNH